MPELYEDAIGGDDPQELERMTHGKIDDVLYADRQRFYKVCRKHGYDCQIIKKESRRKHPDF